MSEHVEGPCDEPLRNALHDVLDPDLGMSLVDLGLVYRVCLDGTVARVLMTLTTRACPASEVMIEGVRRRLSRFPGVTSVEVEITFDPPWTPARISPAGRVQLGW